MSKKKSTQNKNCTSRSEKNSNMSSFHAKIKENLSTIGIFLALIGSGFAAGRYYEHALNTLEYNDKALKLNKELLRVQEENDRVVHELRNQVYELRNELLNQKKCDNEKKY